MAKHEEDKKNDLKRELRRCLKNARELANDLDHLSKLAKEILGGGPLA